MYADDNDISGNIDRHTRSIECAVYGSDELDFAIGGEAGAAHNNVKHETKEDDL